MKPLVSIIIPTYNRASLISQTLDSVLLQTYNNWECIIVDDGSFDNSEEVILSFVKKDIRFRYFKRPIGRNKGASSCRNIGVEKSKGNFIQFLDSDDVLSENKLQDQIKRIKDWDANIICTCKWGRFVKFPNDSVNFDSLNSYSDFNSIPVFLEALASSKGYFPIHAYLIKKSIIDKSGLWNEHLSLNDDSEFLIRLFCQTDKIYFAPNAIVYYRWTSAENISNYNDYQKVDDAILSWKSIELILKIRFKDQKTNYVELMKNGLYINVERSFPELIKKHKLFFKRQIEGQSLLFRGKRKIFNLFIKLWKPRH
ncbi:glycosyltransferase family 2 protein [Flavobacterium sp. NG2]|uniref:glycosyltransferase family 2 protein n=1 Tax=Flavobacterium sp. NG2 TaxID=3097547 RepID=UPI002A81A73F|nr:glycosyltransferase family 2 protein [Flavobacterium sp. NG2]WPR71610.1 glycosyltransferase family 2 protein [Flavobacterium sp. NG2]